LVGVAGEFFVEADGGFAQQVGVVGMIFGGALEGFA
jgi:hypothetical protein